MKVTDKITSNLGQYAAGEVFTISDLDLQPVEYVAAVKAIGRMVQDGRINRVSTGRYYKPNNTVFGELKPSEDELLRTYLFENGKRIAYITGALLYNRLGLTTQVPRIVQIASRDKRVTGRVGNLQIKGVKSYVDVTDANYTLLGLLDALKDFREISDRETSSALTRLRSLLKNLKPDDLWELLTISLKYPPRARALAGALLEANGKSEKTTAELAASLNPLSTYQLGISSSELPTASSWKIQ